MVTHTFSCELPFPHLKVGLSVVISTSLKVSRFLLFLLCRSCCLLQSSGTGPPKEFVDDFTHYYLFTLSSFLNRGQFHGENLRQKNSTVLQYGNRCEVWMILPLGNLLAAILVGRPIPTPTQHIWLPRTSLDPLSFLPSLSYEVPRFLLTSDRLNRSEIPPFFGGCFWIVIRKGSLKIQTRSILLRIARRFQRNKVRIFILFRSRDNR